jgi:glycosyltransferase involved in cell wall biosynthesis
VSAAMQKEIIISLVIPVFNEAPTIKELITTINSQIFQPDEIIIVDGGSTDNTVLILNQLTENNPAYHIIEAGRSMPGKGRNIGAALANSEWLAFTDAGIKLEKEWLKNLVNTARENPVANIIYGNYAPVINNFFEKCATIAYVPPRKPNAIREKFIASCILKKKVWKDADGFPDWRAAEDLIFMERVEEQGVQLAFAPNAMVWWQLRPGLISTYKRFDLYSKYNVWAGRQAFWHYGVAKQYAVILVALFLAFFYSWYWLLLLPLWMAGRITKRIASHRVEFGLKILFNPAAFFLIMTITLFIDAATFSGWIKALLQKKEV